MEENKRVTAIERQIRSTEGDAAWQEMWDRIATEYGLVRSTETDEAWESIVRNAYADDKFLQEEVFVEHILHEPSCIAVYQCGECDCKTEAWSESMTRKEWRDSVPKDLGINVPEDLVPF